MLGESHALLKEFPEYSNIIENLDATDPDFSAKKKKYDVLDGKIRKLELQNSPISDEEMFKLKQERFELKDELYKKLQSAKD